MNKSLKSSSRNLLVRTSYLMLIAASFGCGTTNEVDREIDDDSAGKADIVRPHGTYQRDSAPFLEHQILSVSLNDDSREYTRIDVDTEGFEDDTIFRSGSYRYTKSAVGDHRFIRFTQYSTTNRFEYELEDGALRLRHIDSTEFFTLFPVSVENDVFCHSPFDGCAQIQCSECVPLLEAEGVDCSEEECICSPWTSEDGDPNEPCD